MRMNFLATRWSAYLVASNDDVAVVDIDENAEMLVDLVNKTMLGLVYSYITC